MMNNKYFEGKNLPALIIFTVIIAAGFVAGIGSWNSYQANNKIDIILKAINIPESNIEENNKDYPVNDEFSMLSEKAKRYYDKLSVDRISGTPTWLINGKEYKGFDYRNNVVPGFDISEGFKDVVIFSSPSCGFCIKAEEWMDNNNIEYDKVCAPIKRGDFEKCDSTYIK